MILDALDLLDQQYLHARTRKPPVANKVLITAWVKNIRDTVVNKFVYEGSSDTNDIEMNRIDAFER